MWCLWCRKVFRMCHVIMGWKFGLTWIMCISYFRWEQKVFVIQMNLKFCLRARDLSDRGEMFYHDHHLKLPHLRSKHMIKRFEELEPSSLIMENRHLRSNLIWATLIRNTFSLSSHGLKCCWSCFLKKQVSDDHSHHEDEYWAWRMKCSWICHWMVMCIVRERWVISVAWFSAQSEITESVVQEVFFRKLCAVLLSCDIYHADPSWDVQWD